LRERFHLKGFVGSGTLSTYRIFNFHIRHRRNFWNVNINLNRLCLLRDRLSIFSFAFQLFCFSGCVLERVHECLGVNLILWKGWMTNSFY
jgi:hypothetical protein